MPEGGLDETMSEGLHDMCYRNARVEADKYIAGLRAARAEAGADAWIGARIRDLLQPGVKRKTWRREELQRIVDQADARGRHPSAGAALMSEPTCHAVLGSYDSQHRCSGAAGHDGPHRCEVCNTTWTETR